MCSSRSFVSIFLLFHTRLELSVTKLLGLGVCFYLEFLFLFLGAHDLSFVSYSHNLDYLFLYIFYIVQIHRTVLFSFLRLSS